MEVAAWLTDLGLERYIEAFEQAEIGAETLPELNDADLRELGVPIGPRKKLLKAIGALSPQPVEHTVPSDTSAPTASGEAERRQLTVLFGDMVGSTDLSARLDPEDLREVLRAYHDACAGAITRWEGYVARSLGDGVLAYFGYPQAHEDDAERAVRAGLDLVRSVGALRAPDGAALACRVGIATGQVVVGELPGESSIEDNVAVGGTPNLAARLQALAEPGSVVVGPGTHRLIRGLFDFRDLGRQNLKGFDEPVRAWAVRGGRQTESRFAAHRGAGLTPLVGRHHELGILIERFEQAEEQHEGQVVLLGGEPGIGKSRLVHALVGLVCGNRRPPLRFNCSPHHTNSALYPFIDHLERAAAFLDDDPQHSRLAKLRALLSDVGGGLDRRLPIFASLLSINPSRLAAGSTAPPQRQRTRTIAASIDYIAAMAARGPLLTVLEDGQWIDPTTAELFERVIERIATLPVLLLIAFRPEFSPAWTSYPHVTSLTLTRLGRRQSTKMIASVADGKPLPEEVLTQIWAKTEGVPLFVEELTKVVLESGLLVDQGDRYALAGPLPPLAIPATLQDSLMARLDRVAPTKEMAQLGSVIGREFSYHLIAALSSRTETALQKALADLVASELIFVRGTIPHATYSFKHAFVQDAAYASLLRSKRQLLHGRLATYLIEHEGEAAISQPEVVAHHLTQAGLTERAIEYWCRAGRLAAERSASVEAVAHYRTALELLSQHAETPERDARELDLLTALGSTLIATRGHGSADVRAVYDRARALCRDARDTSSVAPVLQGLRLHHMLRGDLISARAAAEQLLGLGQQGNDTDALLEGYRALGVIEFYRGEFGAAADYLRRAIDLYDGKLHGSHALLYNTDPGQACLSYLARVQWILGFPDQALAQVDQAVAVAKVTGHVASLVEATIWRAEIALLRGEYEDARALATAAWDLAVENELPLWTGMAASIRGWVLAVVDRNVDGLDQLRRGLAALSETSDRLYRSYFLGLYAEALEKNAQADAALAELDEALDGSQSCGLTYWDGILLGLKGDLLLRSSETADAGEACLQAALTLAIEQRARSIELRTALRIARLWQVQGKIAQARDLLAPILGWFAEGSDTADLKNAAKLLQDLR